MATADRLAWRTSTFSGAGQSCVEMAPEPGLAWRTSTFTGNGQSCVEVAPGQHAVRVRDTKDHGLGTVLILDMPAFDALCRSAVDRTADEPLVTHAERRTEHAGTEVVTTWHVASGSGELHFTDAEWEAFAAGVRAGEFAFAPA